MSFVAPEKERPLAEAWYVLAVALLVGYAILDGFDLGAAIVSPFVSKDDDDRSRVLATIGPFWDGNEVFLVAFGGVALLAFSRALGSMLGGLYLGVFLLLWGLLGRGLALELRHHGTDPLWTSACDRVVQLSSGLVALVLGAALGNVIRGGRLDAEGYFGLELFSLASPREGRGVLDAYTLPLAVFAVLTVSMHGALFVAWKAEIGVADRALAAAKKLAVAVAVFWPIIGGATAWTAPTFVARGAGRPAAVGLAVLAIVAIAGVFVFARRREARSAFLASSMFIGANLFAIAGAAFPILVPSVSEHPSLDIARSVNGDHTLAAGLSWIWLAVLLVVIYFANLFRIHRGRILPDEEPHAPDDRVQEQDRHD